MCGCALYADVDLIYLGILPLMPMWIWMYCVFVTFMCVVNLKFSGVQICIVCILQNPADPLQNQTNRIENKSEKKKNEQK